MNRFYNVWCLVTAWLGSSLCVLCASYFILRYGSTHAADYAYVAWNKRRLETLYDTWQILRAPVEHGFDL